MGLTRDPRFRAIQRQIRAVGGTGPAEIRCPCGQVIPRANWRVHELACPEARGEPDRPAA